MEYKYVQFFPKPLLDDFVNNRVVPFIGAGFSKNADIPKGLIMPAWNELGNLAAAELPNYEYDNNPIDTLSYYESQYSRTKLVEFLMKVLNIGKIHPGDTYTALCELFTGTICTTNFDFLLEEAMSSLHRPISTIVTEDRLAINSKDENRILKLHGDFNHPDKMVITENDYDLYLERNPVFATYISNLFICNTMLLVGYSLDDADFRAIWKILNDRLGGMTQPAYCLTVDAKVDLIERYKRRNIRVINLPGKANDYKSILRDVFKELKDYIFSERDKTVRSSNEKVNEQMKIPSKENRLCYISCSYKRVAQISSVLNPILSKYGITALRLDELEITDDSYIDSVETAIRKSNFVIIDVSDDTQAARYEFMTCMLFKKRILPICEEGAAIPFFCSNLQVLLYSLSDYHSVSDFTDRISQWIDSTFPMEDSTDKQEENVFASAFRLFDQHEYSACIVSAFSELEFLIRKANPDLSYKDRVTLTSLISSTNPRVSKAYISKHVNLRNSIVHGGVTAKASEAKSVLSFASKIYHDMSKNILTKDHISD